MEENNQVENTFLEINNDSFKQVSLHEVDEVSITILMDNFIDFLLTNSEHAVRPSLIEDEKISLLPPPIAEHGFAALIRVGKCAHTQGKRAEIKYDSSNKSSFDNIFLFDTGISENGIIHNAKVFGVNLSKIDGIILSHGHFDHFTGLVDVLREISRSGITSGVDLFLHPDSFLKRWEVFPNGKKVKMPFLNEDQLKKEGAVIHKDKDPVYLPNQDSPSILLTGQIPRETNFEKGFPFQYVIDSMNDCLIPDPLVKDDQALIINVKNKGLVILTGCGHAGIINAINYARKLTGIEKIYAILGGFHLPADNGIYEEAIEPTLKELQKANPIYIIPCHCTGWKAINKIIDVMPGKFIQSSVGTIFTF
jgi:7,8-dihydropterin-6-yl-methyl-4-(beta-D-ribofuranosyl)aminobenzene 5'-phosphate synthase